MTAFSVPQRSDPVGDSLVDLIDWKRFMLAACAKNCKISVDISQLFDHANEEGNLVGITLDVETVKRILMDIFKRV